MAKSDFDPPITLTRGIVVFTLDDAAAFLRSYKDSRYPMTRDAVLHRLGTAATDEERDLVAVRHRATVVDAW